jgi:flavodoxin
VVRPTIALDRRIFLRTALVGAASVVAGPGLISCSDTTLPPDAAPTTQPRETGTTLRGSSVLLAYFSRAGENYYYGGRQQLTVGNTEALANLIGQHLDCDVYRIEAADPYSDDYDDTVARNVREQQADARPAITNPLESVTTYQTVLLASPIWNVRAPMIMTTFAESFDFRGKTIHPLTTYAMSGLGTTERDYAELCPGATIGEGLAVQGEEVAGADGTVRDWLRRVGLTPTQR